MQIPIDRIIITKDNPRRSFDEESLRRLGESIKKHGQLENIIVRRSGANYELVTGERRLRATALIGLTAIEANVKDVDDREARYLRLVENTQREDLTESEKGDGIADILREYPEITISDIAKELGKSEITIKIWLQKTIRLSDYVKKCIESNTLPEYSASILLGLSKQEQEKIAKAIINYQIPTGEHGDTHKELVRKYKLNTQKYPSVESMEELADEVKGTKKVKVNLSELSPEARSEIETKIKEEKRQLAKVRRIPRPRTNIRKQGRPKQEEKTDFKYIKAKITRGSGEGKPLKQQIAPTIMPTPETPDYTLCKCATCPLFAKHCKGRCWA